MPNIEKPKPLLSLRSRKVLFSTIAEYVSTGRPVSSRSLTEKHGLGLSPATIRRELSFLTRQGYLIQPHTSAGRIPTDQAFRNFADSLKAQAGQIDDNTRAKLASGLSGLMPGDPRAWQDVVRVLSDISYQAALIVTPALMDSVLKQLRFIPCGPKTLLAVLVTREGLVHNAYVESPKTITDRDLEKIHNYLGNLIEGRTLNDIRKLLRDELNDARIRCDELRQQATFLGTIAIESSVEHTGELVVDGRSYLLAKPELNDKMKELLSLLEEKTRILDLLDRAAATDSGPIVIFGEEAGSRLEGCAIITSPFGEAANKGRVGVIGPMTMNYSALIPLVALAAQFLSTHILGEEK